MTAEPTTKPSGFPAFWALAAAMLGIAVVMAYSNCRTNAFALDDWHAVVENPAIRGLNTDRIQRFFTDQNAFSILPANVDYRAVPSPRLPG